MRALNGFGRRVGDRRFMGLQMTKPIVFISHISEEREIAFALKALVEKSFVGMMDVFVSSDPQSIHLGQQWLRRISFALKSCAVEIVLASPVSVRRQWVNFEAGAGWIRDVPVIPLCHSGMVPAELPAPLNTLQAALASDEEQLRMIFPVLANALGSAIPQVSFSEFVKTVETFEVITAKSMALNRELAIPGPSGLAEHERDTLEEIAELTNAPQDTVSFYQLKDAMIKRGWRKMAALISIKMLERKSLVEQVLEEDYNGSQFWSLRITDEGWLWLEDNKGDLRLPFEKSESSDTFGGVDDEVPF